MTARRKAVAIDKAKAAAGDSSWHFPIRPKMAQTEKPKSCYLGKLAPHELWNNGKGQLFVFWTGLYWSPDSAEAILFPNQTALDDYVQVHPEIKY